MQVVLEIQESDTDCTASSAKEKHLNSQCMCWQGAAAFHYGEWLPKHSLLLCCKMNVSRVGTFFSCMLWRPCSLHNGHITRRNTCCRAPIYWLRCHFLLSGACYARTRPLPCMAPAAQRKSCGSAQPPRGKSPLWSTIPAFRLCFLSPFARCFGAVWPGESCARRRVLPILRPCFTLWIASLWHVWWWLRSCARLGSTF